MRIVVIGSGAAGGSAAFAARYQDRKAEIIAIEKSSRPTYSRCGLPFVIEGVIPSFEKLTVLSHEMYRQQKINVMTDTEVHSMDTASRRLRVTGPRGQDELSYDALVVATGGRASIPDIEGTNLPSVHVLRTAEDGESILSATTTARIVVINGASFIALEAAEALKKRGLDVHLVVRSRALRSMLDPDMSALLHEHLKQNGINVLLGHPVSRIACIGASCLSERSPEPCGSGRNHLPHGSRRNEESPGTSSPPPTSRLDPFRLTAFVGSHEIPTDIVIIATGTEPEVTLAREAGLAIGETGGIRVGDRLETTADVVYAAGDCVESICGITGRPLLTGLGTIATRQGVVAGTNAAGGSEIAPPVLGAAVMKLFGIEIGSVGLTEAQASEYAIPVISHTLKYPSLPHYYPGAEDVRVRLIFKKETAELVGAQFVSAVPVAPRVNAMSIAIQKRMTSRELSQADFCYSPPCADIWDPVAICAQTIARRLGRQ